MSGILDDRARRRTRYVGACHCGAIRFHIDAVLDEITTCDCTLCVKKNAVMVKVHESQLSMDSGTDSLATYRWNTGSAAHHFCTRCGIYTFHRKRSDPAYYGVNVYCLEGVDPAALPHRATDGIGMSTVTSARATP